MLPSELVSTYQKYKQDTDSIAAWLASTAKSVGFSTNFSGPAGAPVVAPVGGGRLKGKARKRAKKQAASSAAKPASQPAGPKYIIGINDFVPLARHIAGKSVRVPSTFGKTIDRVIAARSEFGTKLEEHGLKLHKDSTTNHMYFVEGEALRLRNILPSFANQPGYLVLEEVREVLKSSMPTDTLGQTASATSNLNNRFAALTVDEPSQEFLNAPDIERPTKLQNDHATYESEPLSSPEDAMFALTVFLDDVNQIRSRIGWIWYKYKTGDFDLAAAAITTNTAIELVRNMMEDILPLLKKHGGLGHMLKSFYIRQCLNKGWDIDQTMHSENNYVFNNVTYDDASGTYLHAYNILQAFVGEVDLISVPIGEPCEYYGPTGNRSQKAGLEKAHDDSALLSLYLTELLAYNSGFMRMRWTVQDELLRGMEELTNTGEIPFYMVFAAQIFLDVTYELGPDIERPFRTLMDTISFMDADVEDYFKFHANQKNPADAYDHGLRQLQEHIQRVIWGPRREQNNLLRSCGVDVPEEITHPHRLFQMSPVMSGLALYHFRYRYYDNGIAVARKLGSFTACTYLQTALRQHNLVKGTWPDMNVLYTNLGAESFFVGGEEPKTLVECFKKFCIQIGTSVAVASTHTRPGSTAVCSKAGSRGFKETSPVQLMFSDRYVFGGKGPADLTPEHVARIIELSQFELDDSKTKGSWAARRIEDPKKLNEKRKAWHKVWHGQGQGEPQSKRKEAVEGGRMSPEQLIQRLVLALSAETLGISFPYLHMHRVCWQLLCAANDSCEAVLQEVTHKTSKELKSRPDFVAPYVLMAALGVGSGVTDLRPLHLAAKELNKFLEAGLGEAVCRKILEQKLGIPVHFSAEGEDSS